MIILLKDGTVGQADYDAIDEGIVTVRLHDENGWEIEVTGEVQEILED